MNTSNNIENNIHFGATVDNKINDKFLLSGVTLGTRRSTLTS